MILVWFSNNPLYPWSNYLTTMIIDHPLFALNFFHQTYLPENQCKTRIHYFLPTSPVPQLCALKYWCWKEAKVSLLLPHCHNAFNLPYFKTTQCFQIAMISTTMFSNCKLQCFKLQCLQPQCFKWQMRMANGKCKWQIANYNVPNCNAFKHNVSNCKWQIANYNVSKLPRF